MSPTWIGRLLRARELQEERAKVGVVAAERESLRAAARARAQSARLEALADDEMLRVADAFVASAVALQAAAATHAACRRLADQAESVTRARRDDLRAAARERRSAEELAERQAQAARERAAQALQRDLDEAAANVHLRNNSQESS
jgi:hypothetical protein